MHHSTTLSILKVGRERYGSNKTRVRVPLVVILGSVFIFLILKIFYLSSIKKVRSVFENHYQIHYK